MDVKEIKDNLVNFEINTDVDVDNNNYFLSIETNDITKKLIETFIPNGLKDKRSDVFLPDEVIVKRFLYLKILASEIEQVNYAQLLFEETLVTTKKVRIQLASVSQGVEIIDGLKKGLMKMLEITARLKELKKTIKVEESD
ncbi:MAG: hypothetical protein D4S01_03170 [Dehalococcoidia bacterium]|nr:MAG: hypothetical protein D4S01_03170 [Dehalococcoidia bacterium]